MNPGFTQNQKTNRNSELIFDFDALQFDLSNELRNPIILQRLNTIYKH